MSLATVNRVLRALEQAEAKIVALEQRRDEPIAIVGLGCRLPRGNSPEAFWRALDAGIDAVSEIPESRWRLDASLRKARWAALLDDTDVMGFDAGFFGVSPREAAAIDPQQRLFLEVSVEALEDAGVPLESVRGSRTGVFVGMMTLDYQHLSMGSPIDKLDIYTSTGIGACFGSGRLSHILGFEGPSLSTDAACSSSLVALHLACQSLRARECDLAVAGGVNLMLSPWTMHLFVNMQALSPEGRCRTFDAGSNGFVRGEGCGAIVLKRLSDALRDGDSIRALVRGSAVNHNGRSSGLTAPSVLAQRALLQQALAASQVQPQDISYIEAHGIGTPLGDPIEIEALKAVVGAPRPDGSNCVIGSVKTNVGHLEAAAGIAGIIKTVLAFEHERIPPHLHLETLNPRIELQGSALAISGPGQAWPRGARPRRAGVSAFGLSGTNAHVVLEEAPAPAAGAVELAADGLPHVVVVTARSEASLRRLVARYAERLEAEPALPIRDVAYTTAMRRSHHPHRLAVVGRTSGELASSLRRWLDGVELPHLRTGRAAPSGAPLVFLYSGDAEAWRPLGRALDERSEAFHRALQQCQEAFSALGATVSLLDQLRASPPERPELSALALFALQVAVTAEWRACGVVPDRVLGDGIGELAAAHAAGILPLEAAAEVVWRRSEVLAQAGKPPPALLAEAAKALEPRLSALTPKDGHIPFFSAVTGQRETGETLGASHWARQLREPVRLGEALQQALGGEPGVVVQVHASAAPAALMKLTEPGSGQGRVRVASSLRPDAPGRQVMLEALAEVFVAGGAVAWSEGPHARGRLVRLPTYAWELERHWLEQTHGEPVAASAVRPDSAGAAEREAKERKASPLLVQRWQPRASSPGAQGEPSQSGGKWLLVGSDEPHSTRLSALLRAAGQNVTSWQWDGSDAAIEAALTMAFGEEDARGIVVCGGFGGSLPDKLSGAELQVQVERECRDVLQLAQRAAQRRWRRAAPRLWLITESSQRVVSNEAGGGAPAAALRGAALWGLGRTIGLEHPELRCTRLDIEKQSELEQVVAELLRDATDEELGLRGTSWYAGHLERPSQAPGHAHREPSQGRPFRLELDRAGILDQMKFRVAQVAPPGPGQVRVKVASAGLNFMDVMTAMGIYPGANTGGLEPIILGGECAGVIEAVGPGVETLSVGDQVVAVGRGCFGSFLTTDAAYVQRRPEGLDTILAGGVPIVFLTAWYALITLGRLQPKERVLIHSAASGVGLAAVQIAQWRGAEIYATAGTEEKRELLRQMGLTLVLDSRTQAFSAEILEATGGEGVDMVLNSLSGESIESSIATLASDGRFFEIGKTDIYSEDRALRLLPFRKRISYQAVDLLGLAQERKQRFAALFAEVMEAFASDVLRPLPTEVFAAASTLEAFRLMASGRHTGKLVVKAEGAEVEVEQSTAPVIDERASYLVTGGASALGLSLTEWLVEQGARHIVWLSHRGPAGVPTSEATRLEALRARGLELKVHLGDVSQEADVAAAVTAAEAMGPLRGVVHAANVDDTRASPQSGAAPSAVMMPKVAGAWNVHMATERAPLDFFVLCSSASALLGAPGLAWDAAANAFLDGLARHRRHRGQAALSVQWGPVSAEDGGATLAAGGVWNLAPHEAWQALRALLAAGTDNAGVIRFNARQLIEYHPHLASGTRFLPLLASGDEPIQAGDRALLARFAKASEAERIALIEQLIRQQLAQLLRTDLDRIEQDLPFKSLGIDSLMGLELRNRLEAALGISLSAALLWAYPDMRSLREYLLSRLIVSAPPVVEERGPAVPRDTADQSALMDLRQLSDEQKAARLEQELESLERLLQ
ncbi:type I polyketide synthase [Stigmatella aurantiaca]|uniref:Polyketide synthase AufE n=2 Tax=Stigmatella aurantiaca TaxID=41 RepID=A8YP93_STIAU|nr:type I polyketide synthase [Stigmatella aurantiaca]ADO72989.1 Polyketide synthase AufE [Stigmatella aurantiaca DW4/3-1]CAO98848.1 polyketide synthase AufE [Stigmatella aurantiaca DW4/3-1]